MRLRTGHFQTILPFVCVLAIYFTIQDPTHARDDEDDRAILSEEFDFIVDERIPINMTIGRVHVTAIMAGVKASGGDRKRVTFRVEMENPKGHDQEVAIRIELLDDQGNLVRSGETTKGIEEKESKKFKVVIYVDFPPVDIVKSFHLEMQAWDD